MKINIHTIGLEKVQKQLRMLSDKSVKESLAKAINNAAYHTGQSLFGSNQADGVFS